QFWRRAFTQPISRNRQSFRPLLESLEDRTTPTSLLSIGAAPNPIVTGAGTFSLTLTFDGPMNSSILPTGTFPTPGEDPGPTLSFLNAQISSTDPNSFITTYAVSDQNVAIPMIDVRVSGAVDFSNAAVAAATKTDVFSIDTQHPVQTSLQGSTNLIIKS